MTQNQPDDPQHFVEAIQRSGLSIYDHIEIGDPELWIPTPELEFLLDRGLSGISLGGLPLRTRSKVVKEHICRALGYPVPLSFRMTQPRFPGQLFDSYVQKSNNLQIWNEELVGIRRYVLIRISGEGTITRVKAVTGDSLAALDTTGTLTGKFQARCIPGTEQMELITSKDTELLRPLTHSSVDLTSEVPTNHPQAGKLLTIRALFERLTVLVGQRFAYTGADQERTRGAALHRLACQALGYTVYRDDGQFPDLRHQLLELKLQTSPTIDLGLVSPDSIDALDVPQIQHQQIRHCDVRYAIFYGQIDANQVELTHLFATTGAAFFRRFPRFGGNILNRKLQIPLRSDFFEG